MVVILGPTATGKTRIAALLANAVNGEIISADSRQVYKKMDIGTGKDLEDYIVNGREIKAHLIDVVSAGEKYDVFRFKNDFESAYKLITAKDKIPILCGGSGMYLESALGLYDLKKAETDTIKRIELEQMNNVELISLLKSLKIIHNTTDLTDRDRLIRAVEIALASEKVSGTVRESMYDNLPSTQFIYGIDLPRNVIKERIQSRLEKRLNNGMIEEVQKLMNEGVPTETLYYYGLEYRYISCYLSGEMSFTDMFNKLNIAIGQFAKRQMTWFRRMEKRGIKITWLQPDPDLFIKKVMNDIAGI